MSPLAGLWVVALLFPGPDGPGYMTPPPSGLSTLLLSHEFADGNCIVLRKLSTNASEIVAALREADSEMVFGALDDHRI